MVKGKGKDLRGYSSDEIDRGNHYFLYFLGQRYKSTEKSKNEKKVANFENLL